MGLKIAQWREGLKAGLEAGQVPRIEETISYYQIPSKIIKCKIKYETNLTAAMPEDQMFTLKILAGWSIQNVPQDQVAGQSQ